MLALTCGLMRATHALVLSVFFLRWHDLHSLVAHSCDYVPLCVCVVCPYTMQRSVCVSVRVYSCTMHLCLCLFGCICVSCLAAFSVSCFCDLFANAAAALVIYCNGLDIALSWNRPWLVSDTHTYVRAQRHMTHTHTHTCTYIHTHTHTRTHTHTHTHTQGQR